MIDLIPLFWVVLGLLLALSMLPTTKYLMLFFCRCHVNITSGPDGNGHGMKRGVFSSD